MGLQLERNCHQYCIGRFRSLSSQQQLEWIVGRNPFGQSLMYGVGYDFPTMFVYCTHNTVGALAVGIDSFQNDEPYWHPSAYATFKEIWIEPVNRFLGTLAAWGKR